jgi:ribosomal protein S18 acetylase RimI-like enzyme
MNSEGGSFGIREAAPGERDSLVPLLEESFTGIYLRHAKRTLDDVETVRVALVGEAPVGLAMLKLLSEAAGYVYYIAVRPSSRRTGVGSRLLVDSLDHFVRLGATEVYASVGEDNIESNSLFLGRGFRRTDYGQVSKKYGMLKALSMYRSMFVVPGEILLAKEIATGPSALP